MADTRIIIMADVFVTIFERQTRDSPKNHPRFGSGVWTMHLTTEILVHPTRMQD